MTFKCIDGKECSNVKVTNVGREVTVNLTTNGEEAFKKNTVRRKRTEFRYFSIMDRKQHSHNIAASTLLFKNR
jgi:hypothetical protein